MDKLIITSLQNPVIKQVKELQNKKSARKKKGLFIVEGIRGVHEIPRNKGWIQYLIVTEKIEVPESIVAEKIMRVSEEVFSKISETQAPQGMLAIVKMPSYSISDLERVSGKQLILENLQDPGNLGTIIRSAHAFGFKSVLLTKGCVDVYSPKVVRSTMSSLFYLPIITDYTIEEYVEAFKQRQIPIYVTALNASSKPIGSLSFPNEAVLVIGNEGNGVSDYCLQEAHHTMIIPMPGGAESLNASVAAGICMYEMSR